MKDTELSRRITQARLIAGELWELLRKDASHRLGLAEAYPQAIDKTWTPEFYRKCQLAERLFAILDDVSSQGEASAGVVENERVPEAEPLEPPRVVPHVARHSRRRLGV